MDLEEALNRLCNLFWARDDCPANKDDPNAPLIVLHNVLQSIRTVWLDDKIEIRGRRCDRPGEKGAWRISGDPERITPYKDMHLYVTDDSGGFLIYIYRQPTTGPTRRGWPTAELRELTIRDEDFDCLRRELFSEGVIEGLGRPASDSGDAQPVPPMASPAVDAQPLQPEPQKRKPRSAPKATAMLEWLDQQSEATRRQTPTYLARRYCKEHPGTGADPERYALKVFSNPEHYRGRE